MADSKLLQQVSKKDSDKEAIAVKVINQPELLSEVFEGLNADQASIKYGCDKILRLISEKAPALLYPHFDFFANNLGSENTFFKWGAIHMIKLIRQQLKNSRNATKKAAEKFVKKNF